MRKSVAILIGGYLIGLMVFYTMAVFENPTWGLAYGVWAKIFDMGVGWWILLYLNSNGEEKKIIKWLIVFGVLRLLWEIPSNLTGIGVNNHWGVAALFLALVFVISAICFREFRKIEKYL